VSAYTANDRVGDQNSSWLCTADVAAPASGQNPAPDADPAHWQLTTFTVNGRFHCYYHQATPVDFVALDRDDQELTGPEHVVVSPRQVAGQPTGVPGEYHYWVRDFSGEKT
jgi:hypothetical protein